MDTVLKDKKRIMVVFAQPDDAEFTTAGIIARRVAEGHRCHQSQVSRGVQVEEQMLAWNQTLGEQYGVPYVEEFRALRPHCEICR